MSHKICLGCDILEQTVQGRVDQAAVCCQKETNKTGKVMTNGEIKFNDHKEENYKKKNNFQEKKIEGRREGKTPREIRILKNVR